MFACLVCVVSTYEYLTIWINTNLGRLLNGSTLSIHLLYFIIGKKIQILLTQLIRTMKNQINIFFLI